MWMRAFGELLGTALLVMLGNGCNYSTSGKRFFANQSGRWIIVALGWAMAVMCGIIVAQALGSPGHLNPAVSIFSAISTKSGEPILYILFQLIGAAIGQIVLNFINWKHICEMNLLQVRGGHCTTPAFSNDKEKATLFNFSYEFIGTIVLIGLIWALSNGTNSSILRSMGPVVISFVILSIGLSLGSSTGYAINPARDFVPRIVFLVMEKTVMKNRKLEWVGPDLSYGWIPVVAPISAGLILSFFTFI